MSYNYPTDILKEQAKYYNLVKSNNMKPARPVSKPNTVQSVPDKVKVIITTFTEDEELWFVSHQNTISFINKKFGIDEYGANGGFGYYFTHGTEYYELKGKLAEIYNKFGLEDVYLCENEQGRIWLQKRKPEDADFTCISLSV